MKAVKISLATKLTVEKEYKNSQMFYISPVPLAL